MRLVVLLLSLLCASPLPATELLAAVQARISTARVTRGNYAQVRELVGITKPLRGTGSFTVDRERGVVWRSATPFESVLRIKRGEIVQKEGAQVLMRLSGEREPTVQAISSVLFALFSADLEALARYFDFSGHADGAQWELKLEPRDASMRRLISSLAMRGDRTVAHVDLAAASGDLLHIEFKAVETAAEPSAAEVAEFD